MGYMSCNTSVMTIDDRRERLAQAGEWLREQRVRRGITTAVEFANRLGVDKALVSNYERGVSEVSDERAKKISEVLGIDEIEVRRNLGLWVPARRDEAEGEAPSVVTPSDEELLAMVPAAIAERDRGNPESYNLLMFVWRTRHPEQRDATQTNATSNEPGKTA
jgi:transcriptional regulator with XRE-family HTH domain